MAFYSNITNTIGVTPLLRLNRITENIDAQIFAKLEFFNPLGSVKDRVALAMIEDAEKRGVLKKDSVVVEPTSGNTGIGLACVAAVKGLRLILTMPETMSRERISLLKYLGAELELTPGHEGMRGAVSRAEEIVGNIPGAFMPNQFGNPANPRVHRETTAEEIWADTKGGVDILVAGVGTGGTITGVSEIIKERKPSFRAVAVEPAESPVLTGGLAGAHKIQGIGAGFIPEILNLSIIDEVVTVSGDAAIDMAGRMARLEGILCGISSGAALCAAIKIAEKSQNTKSNIVVILPDTGERYLSSLKL